MVAALFEGHGYKEEKQEEGEEDEAPGHPELIAASYKAIDNANQEAKKKSPQSIEEGVDPQVPQEQIASTNEAEGFINSMQNVFNLLHEVFDNDGTPSNTENQESLLDPSSSSDQQHPTAFNVQVSAFAITPTPQAGDQPSLAGSDQGHVEIPILTTEESMSPPQPHYDCNNQSLPLLEATLVQDIPEEPIYIYMNTNSQEPVYNAFPLSDTDNDEHGLLRKNTRLIIIGLVLVGIAAIISAVVPLPLSGTVMNNVSEKIAACLLFFVGRDQHLSHLHLMHTFASQSTDPIVTSTTSTLTENSTTTKMNTVH
jgi:hypothetical protein